MIHALGKNVVVIPKAQPEQKKSLIITSTEEKPKFWEIISIGEDVRLKLALGDIICMTYAPAPIIIDDNKFYIIPSEQIQARISHG